MHVAWRKTVTSKFSVQENFATPIPMYNLADYNKLRSKIMLFSILCKIHDKLYVAQYTLHRPLHPQDLCYGYLPGLA